MHIWVNAVVSMSMDSKILYRIHVANENDPITYILAIHFSGISVEHYFVVNNKKHLFQHWLTEDLHVHHSTTPKFH